MPRILDKQVAFATPWFDVVAITLEGQPLPHYSVTPQDYVTVLATAANGDVLLVRQFRPVIERYTLELPSGLVDSDETAEATVRRELVEETGHEADAVHFVGTLVPDVGRLGNRMHCFVADGARPIAPAPPLEDGLELVTCTHAEFVEHLRAHRLEHALNFAAVMLAVLHGRFKLS